MNITELFESSQKLRLPRCGAPTLLRQLCETTIKLRGFAEKSGSAAEAFMDEFDAKTMEHPFTRGMRYLENGPVLLQVSASPDHDDEVDLRDIQSKAPGAGAQAMKLVCALADKHNVTIDCYAMGYAHVPTEKLIEYYKRFGFEARSAFHGEGLDMVRRPNR